MAYRFSQNSENNLKDVHPKLVKVVRRVMGLQRMDFSVAEGLRTRERQWQLVQDGKSKTMNSKHLAQKDGFGHAVDLYPYPINMNRVNKGDAKEIARFAVLAGMMYAAAAAEGVEIVSGIDWDSDGETLDHRFFDAPHFQIVFK